MPDRKVEAWEYCYIAYIYPDLFEDGCMKSKERFEQIVAETDFTAMHAVSFKHGFLAGSKNRQEG